MSIKFLVLGGGGGILGLGGGGSADFIFMGAWIFLTHIAQYPFEIVSQRVVSHPCALFSKGIAQVSLRYPFEGRGGIAPPLRMLSKGETLRKKGRGYRTQMAMLRHRNRGVSLR